MDSHRRILDDLNDGPGSCIQGRVQAEENVIELTPEPEAPVAPLSFEELFLDVHDRLYRALYFITGSSADAEELMQDAFLKLWEQWDRIDRIDRIDDPVAYLFRSGLNGFRMRMRSTRTAARRLMPVARRLSGWRRFMRSPERRTAVGRAFGMGDALRSCSAFLRPTIPIDYLSDIARLSTPCPERGWSPNRTAVAATTGCRRCCWTTRAHPNATRSSALQTTLD